MRMFQFCLLLLISFVFIECATPPEYPDEPVIEFLSVSKDTIQEFGSGDVFILTFSFTDGDGDFGLPQDDTIPRNVFIRDSRTDDLISGFKTPVIPDLGASDAIKGEVSIEIFSPCCIYPDYICGQPLLPNQPPFDEIFYKITVTDRAGNISNEITTTPLAIQCE